MSLRHAILGFLDLEPTTGYTLQQRFQGSVGSFWTSTQSQIYRELHGLEKAGLAEVEVIAAKNEARPPRKVYTLTRAGRAELERWLAEPVEAPQLRDPLLLKLVFAAAVDQADLDAVLAGYAVDLEARRREYQARLSAKEILDLARSPRERMLWELSIENGLAWCEAQLGWTRRARQRLKAVSGKPTTRRRNKR